MPPVSPHLVAKTSDSDPLISVFAQRVQAISSYDTIVPFVFPFDRIYPSSVSTIIAIGPKLGVSRHSSKGETARIALRDQDAPSACCP